MKKSVFEQLETLAKGAVRDPAALSAWIGRKKEGNETFQKQAASGKRHEKKTDKAGGGKRFEKLEHTLGETKKAWPSSEIRAEKLTDKYETNGRTIKAKFDGSCKLCNKRFKAGDSISYHPKARATTCVGNCRQSSPQPGTPKEGSD